MSWPLLAIRTDPPRHPPCSGNIGLIAVYPGVLTQAELACLKNYYSWRFPTTACPLVLPPPSPPPPPVQMGQATASIFSPQQDPLTGVLYAPPDNNVTAYATCQVTALYAAVGQLNWPAQMQLCGSPPGSDSCVGVKYNASNPTLQPFSVTFDNTTNKYTAYYNLAVYPAWDSQQPITHRYFLCLYIDPVSEY